MSWGSGLKFRSFWFSRKLSKNHKIFRFRKSSNILFQPTFSCVRSGHLKLAYTENFKIVGCRHVLQAIPSQWSFCQCSLHNYLRISCWSQNPRNSVSRVFYNNFERTDASAFKRNAHAGAKVFEKVVTKC